jgi:hypothetical protein
MPSVPWDGGRFNSRETMRQESGSPRRSSASVGQPDSFGMLILRIWIWAVPIVMLVAAAIFAAIAVADGRWGLFVVMLFMGAVAVSLLVFHWWVVYRFGNRAGGG